VDRRDFLKEFIKWTLGILGLSAFASSIFLYPPEAKKMEIKYFPAADINDAPQKGVKKITLTYTANNGTEEAIIFLAVLSQGLTAFSSVCSHLGCIVDWDSRKEEFVCPCHGGRYDMKGNVIGGPPPAPLVNLPIEIRDGKIFVGIKV
jgi:cytochrome b6-f complex iron-sulfur subunit